MESVLVVGASGILAPAAATLSARGARVTGVSRRGEVPGGVESLHVDARDSSALGTVLNGRSWDAALVYGPAVSARSLERIRPVAGRVVVVRTSADADPGKGDFVLPELTLQLGWASDGDTARWHTAAEVSDAALAVLGDGRARILGSIRPWERRP